MDRSISIDQRHHETIIDADWTENMTNGAETYKSMDK